jgi:hypothetical protein
MRKARKRNSKTPVWKFSWWHVLPNGKHVRRKRQVGTLDQYKTEAAAERAVRSWRLAINSNQAYAFSGITMKDVIEHFRLKELAGKGENRRAWSTRDRYESYLDRWIGPRWGREELTDIKAPVVEEWLEDLRFDTTWRQKKAVRHGRQKPETLPLSPASKSRIHGLMSVLFNHAIRWGFTDRNPISGPNRGAGVRQSSKRLRIPDLLEVEEFQKIVDHL